MLGVPTPGPLAAWVRLPALRKLLAGNPFPEEPPRFVRADLFLYEFTSYADVTDAWWKRGRIRPYVSPLSRDAEPLQRFLRRAGWLE